MNNDKLANYDCGSRDLNVNMILNSIIVPAGISNHMPSKVWD